MSDRFDEIAKKCLFAATVHHKDRDCSFREAIEYCFADAIRSAWNEAIEAAAQHFYKTARPGCGEEIRELKEQKR